LNRDVFGLGSNFSFIRHISTTELAAPRVRRLARVRV